MSGPGTVGTIDHNAKPRGAEGRAIVFAEAKSAGPSGRKRRAQATTVLVVPGSLFGDDLVDSLLEAWLLPALVDRFLKGRYCVDPTDSKDNGPLK